jgi:hypothetical protein
MHPLLVRKDHLAIYLACWIPIAILLAMVLAGGGLGWGMAAGLSAPLALVYAFICLASWYLCRALPLGGDEVVRPVATHMASAAVSSGLWTFGGLVLARAMDGSTKSAVSAGYSARMPLVFVVGTLLFLLAVASHYVLIAVEASRTAEKRALNLKVLAGEAELRALKAQVDPHFLFNSLHSISALTGSDPGAARSMCLMLGDFLRRRTTMCRSDRRAGTI